MQKKRFSLFGIELSLNDETNSIKNFQERTYKLNQKLNSLTHEQRVKYKKDLVEILEIKDACLEYGAKNPEILPQRDILIIKETLYDKHYSS